MGVSIGWGKGTGNRELLTGEGEQGNRGTGDRGTGEQGNPRLDPVGTPPKLGCAHI